MKVVFEGDIAQIQKEMLEFLGRPAIVPDSSVLIEHDRLSNDEAINLTAIDKWIVIHHNKIAALKELRTFSGWGLREAKDWIDQRSIDLNNGRASIGKNYHVIPTRGSIVYPQDNT